MADHAVHLASLAQFASTAQLKRIYKIYNEPFYVISSGAADTVATFEISGSKRAVYRIVVNTATRKITCNCPDSYLNCSRLRCHCKHACFLVFRVFRGVSVDPDGFFTNLQLTRQEVDAIVTRMVTNDFDRMQVTQVTQDTQVKNKGDARRDFEKVLRVPSADDECPVCYCLLLWSKKSLLGCPDCGNGIHQDCAQRWMQHAEVPTCVYCRSTVWKDCKF